MDAFKALFADVPAIDMVYVRTLLSVGREDDVDLLRVCQEVGIKETLVSSCADGVSMNQFLALMEMSEKRLPRTDWALRFGLACGLQTHRMLALPLFHRDDPVSLAQFAVASLSLRLPFVQLSARMEHEDLVLEMHEHWPLGRGRARIFDLYFGTLSRFISQMGKSMTLCVDTDTDPEHFRCLRDCRVMPGHPANQLVVHSYSDGNFLPSFSRAPAPAGLNTQTQQMLLVIRRLVMLDPGRSCTIERVAEKLGTTPRTLSRYLSAANLSFTGMRNDVRAQHAERFLRESSMPIAAIAERLGYSDQASFSKAFRTWTGKSPGDFRRSGAA